MFGMDAKKIIAMRALELKAVFHKELDAIYGKDEVACFFFLCLEFYLNLPKFELTINPEFTIVKSEYPDFFNALEALKNQKPIQYILGETEFYGLKFKLNNNVLIPRQETEELVDLVLKDIKVKQYKTNALKILDIGTGSGCIAISLAKQLPDAMVYALDVSADVIKIAQQNADLNAVTINYIQADILDEFHKKPDYNFLEFDIIISNPPYVRHLEKPEIKPNVLNHEPHLALFVEDTNPLVFYKAIAELATISLKSNGYLYFEINQYLGLETKKVLTDKEFKDVTLFKDLNGNDRILRGLKA